MPGDRVLTLSLAPKAVDLRRGDIVVFKDPANWLRNEQSNGVFGEDRLIKRLIGLPGDVVECAGEGSPVTINGVAVDESSYIREGVSPSSFPFRVEVTEGHVFVMGDNRSNSADSRYHQDDEENGLVPLEDIEGVALATYWPLQRIGVLDAHHDVFADVPGRQSVGLASRRVRRRAGQAVGRTMIHPGIVDINYYRGGSEIWCMRVRRWSWNGNWPHRGMV